MSAALLFAIFARKSVRCLDCLPFRPAEFWTSTDSVAAGLEWLEMRNVGNCRVSVWPTPEHEMQHRAFRSKRVQRRDKAWPVLRWTLSSFSPRSDFMFAAVTGNHCKLKKKRPVQQWRILVDGSPDSLRPRNSEKQEGVIPKLVMKQKCFHFLARSWAATRLPFQDSRRFYLQKSVFDTQDCEKNVSICQPHGIERPENPKRHRALGFSGPENSWMSFAKHHCPIGRPFYLIPSFWDLPDPLTQLQICGTKNQNTGNETYWPYAYHVS